MIHLPRIFAGHFLAQHMPLVYGGRGREGDSDEKMALCSRERGGYGWWPPV